MSTTAQSITELVGQWNNFAARASVPANAGARGGGGARLESLQDEGPAADDLLTRMLIVAGQLEFATIPPYLCALWSIDDELDPVAQSIREIVQEEMLHLALVCNLLAALDQSPAIADWAPRYPAKLPMQVHAGLEVNLQGFNRDALRDFIRIEAPERFPENIDYDEQAARQDGLYWKDETTIGALYETILAAFRHLRPVLKTDTQVTGPLCWRRCETLADVEWAIRTIQQQGEGAIMGPLDSGREDLAHYYRFLEVWKERRLRYDAADRRYYWRGKLAFPSCRPMAVVPRGGFSQPKPEAQAHLRKFDLVYGEMLKALEDAWRSPSPGEVTGQGALMRAYSLMFALGGHARVLMRMPMGKDDKSTYGPQFTPPNRPDE